jgi:hypothetical protein
MTTSTPTEVRIPVRPQRWLFVINLIVQPPLTALFAWMALDADGLGSALFGAVLALVTLLLCGFSLAVLVRTWGKQYELVVGETVEIPNLMSGRVVRVPLTAIRGGQVIETRARGVPFYSLTLQLVPPATARSAVISSQLVGPAALARFREALAIRGVVIT